MSSMQKSKKTAIYSDINDKEENVDEANAGLDAQIEQLEEESNFKQRIALMQMLLLHISALTKKQLMRLHDMISEDKNGLFNRTWNSLAFALIVQSKLNQPNTSIAGFQIGTVTTLLRTIGRGLSGEVRLATVSFNAQKKKYAVKYLSVVIAHEQEDEEAVTQEHLEEIITLSKLCKSPKTQEYCVNVHGLTIGSDQKVGVVMEPYGMNLENFIKKVQLTVAEQKQLFTRCVMCLNSLHNFGANGIVHNDVKAANFLVGAEDDDEPTLKTKIGSIVITDFGFSKERARQTEKHFSRGYSCIGGIAGKAKGTVAWAAPEIKGLFRDGGSIVFTKRSDIYSLGVLLGSIITRLEPYHTCKTEYQILTDNFQIFPEDVLAKGDPVLTSIYKWCTEIDKNNRASCCEHILEALQCNDEDAVKLFIANKQGTSLPIAIETNVEDYIMKL